jgi:hypothetical protein
LVNLKSNYGQLSYLYVHHNVSREAGQAKMEKADAYARDCCMGMQ